MNKIKIVSGLSAGTVKDLSNLFHITFLIILIIVFIHLWIIWKRFSYWHHILFSFLELCFQNGKKKKLFNAV